MATRPTRLLTPAPAHPSWTESAGACEVSVPTQAMEEEHEVHDFDGSVLPCFRALCRGDGQAARVALEAAILAAQRAGE